MTLRATEKKSPPMRDNIPTTEHDRSTRHTQFMKLPQQTHKQVIQYASPNDYQTIIKTNKYLATLMKTKNDNRMKEIEKERLTETSLSRFINLLVEYTRWKKVELNIKYIQKFIKKTPFQEKIVDVITALLHNRMVSKIRLDILDICQHVAHILKNKFADFLMDHVSFFIRHVSPSVLKDIFHMIADRNKREAVVAFFVYEATIHNRLKLFQTRQQALGFLQQFFLNPHDKDLTSLRRRIGNATLSPSMHKSH